MNYQADISPLEIINNFFNDEPLLFRPLDSLRIESFPFQNERKEMIEKVQELGQKLRQSTLTQHIACSYVNQIMFHKIPESALLHYSKHKL